MACASFPTLPPELKAKIVKVTSDQEYAHRIRVEDGPEPQRAGHINSLSSLALVDKELRQLAATHQFKILKASRASSPVFRYSILQRHGHHIVKIKFSASSNVGLDGEELSLSIMDRLPALRELDFSHAKATKLFGSGVTLRPDLENETGSYRASILAFISHKIEYLTLYSFPLAETVALIKEFPNLKRLDLFNLRNPHQVERLEDFTSAISSLRKLQDLLIDMNEGSTGVWPAEALAPLAHDPPRVEILELHNLPLWEHTVQLVKIFSSTLRCLTLEFEPQVATPDLTSVTPIQLPHLKTLELSTIRARLPALFRLLTSASTISLFTHYSHPDDDVPLEPTDPVLLSFLNSQSSLRVVHLWDTDFEFFQDGPPVTILPSPTFLVAYTNLVESRSLDPTVLDFPHLSPFHPHADLDYTENESKFLTATLRRTLQFGMDELDRMEAEGNVAKSVRWVPRLRALEDERLAWKD
ncbi:hypothetical protein RQP46_002395 [Phenoliferia psychrophenolica]